MNTLTHAPRLLAVALTAALGLGSPSLEAAQATLDAQGIRFVPDQPAAAYHLRVMGPAGLVVDRTFPGTEPLRLDTHAGWTEGSYRYEITPATGDARRGEGDAAGSDAQGAPAESGSFHVEGGVIYLPADGAGGNARTDTGIPHTPVSTRDQVIPDDLIVQGSECVGFNCVNNENFGFDTIRLKEDNTRIKFEDTSTIAGFPSTDWQLTANDSASGGQNRFSIEDVTAGRIPFTVLGNAPNNSLFVDAFGRVGLGTGTPVLRLHLNSGDTPGLRLEQNNSAGFTPQTWDIAGNEANFFVRDVTGGSRLPLRIRPGAPTSSLDINALGNVGINTGSPAARLHVNGTDGNAQLLVRETNATATGRDLMRLENNGPSRFRMMNTATGNEWSLNAHNSDFRITPAGAVIVAMTIFPNGNVTIAGTLTQNSDRAQKENFRQLDHKTLLSRLAALDISEWNFKAEGENVRHVGPMAQDFRAAFGLGDRDDRIAPLDTSGVALAAVQALQKELTERDRRIAELERRLQRLDDLSQRLARLERQQPGQLASHREPAVADVPAGF